MSSDISSKILKSWRERAPSSYSIKIQNLFQLENSSLYSNGKYESQSFTSGDYKWKLIIYPKGNDKDNGSGFISMYVGIDTASLVSKTPPEVFADIRFFIFNKNENKYFTIQDVEPKLFYTLRTMRGFSQVLPLETFIDHKNGYIFDGDHCEFGVDIILAPPPTNWEMLSFVKPSYPKFSWSLKNFSNIKENSLASNIFSKGDRKWVIKLYPKGNSTPDGKWLSMFLDLAGDEIVKEDEKIHVQANMILKDPRGSNHFKRKLNWCYESSIRGSGWEQYVSIEELRKSYLDNEDTLRVVEFGVVSSAQYYSFIV